MNTLITYYFIIYYMSYVSVQVLCTFTFIIISSVLRLDFTCQASKSQRSNVPEYIYSGTVLKYELSSLQTSLWSFNWSENRKKVRWSSTSCWETPPLMRGTFTLTDSSPPSRCAHGVKLDYFLSLIWWEQPAECCRLVATCGYYILNTLRASNNWNSIF